MIHVDGIDIEEDVESFEDKGVSFTKISPYQ